MNFAKVSHVFLETLGDEKEFKDLPNKPKRIQQFFNNHSKEDKNMETKNKQNVNYKLTF